MDDGPKKFCPHGEMVPNQFGSPGQIVARIFYFSRGQAVGIRKYGDLIGWGPFVLGDQYFGTICPWGTNLMGTVCQGGSIL